ncbi:MAG: hypothetical protein ACP5F1_03730 [Thermoplasmata archaeon]|nr:hypothetical protein [Thermoplasmata archaeon]
MAVAIMNINVFLETILVFAVLVLFAGGIAFYILGTDSMKKKSLYMGIAGLVLLIALALVGAYLDGLKFFAENILVPVLFYLIAIVVGALIGAIGYILMIFK